jgi:hypothetical protein
LNAEQEEEEEDIPSLFFPHKRPYTPSDVLCVLLKAYGS